MNIHDINELVEILNKNDIQYCSVEYVENEHFWEIFVHTESLNRFCSLMQELEFEKTHSSIEEYTFIYRLVPDAFWENENGIRIHSACQMSCISLSNLSKFKLPLDNSIQKSIWDNAKWNCEKKIWQLNSDDYMIFLLTRSIFDKKSFDNRDIQMICELNINWEDEAFLEKMESVFFKFTPNLIRLIKTRHFEMIIHDHRTFCDY